MILSVRSYVKASEDLEPQNEERRNSGFLSKEEVIKKILIDSLIRIKNRQKIKI